MIKDLIKNFKIIKYVFKFCPIYCFFSVMFIICNVATSVLRVAMIAEVGKIISESLKLANPMDGFYSVVNVIILYIILNGIAVCVRRFYNSYLKGYYRTYYVNKMLGLMYSKVKDVDFADFDNPEFYDIYSRAMREGGRGFRAYDDIVNFVSAVVNTIALGTFIVISDIYLILIVLLSTIIRVVISAKKNKNQWKFDHDSETDRRMYYYVNRTFYQQRFAAEIKTTPISDLLIEKCYDAQESIDKLCFKTIKKNSVLSVLNNVISYLFEMGAVYFYLSVKILKESIDISGFTSILDASNQFSNNFVEMARFVNNLKNNALYINYFVEYMEYQPKLETTGKLDIEGNFKALDFDNIEFSYPNTSRKAIDGIKLEISRGKKLAIVGLNGAGKTTLIKMLLKFYNPDQGDIYYNDQTIRDTKEEVIRKKFAIVFQDYRIYAVSIAENILMRKVESEEDEKRVWKALEKVGLADIVREYPDGIYTMQTRELNEKGLALSGGQMQRIAIARVFASDADVYVLDEPTSALDPLAERDINRLIIEKSKDKTIIIIAHRLSTVVDADEIILIENGKIVEQGSHEDLLKSNGKYALMFNTQAALYIRNNKI